MLLFEGAATYDNWSGNGRLHSGHPGEMKDAHARKASDRLTFSNRCGRIRLQNVKVQNRGIDWEDEHNCFWSHKVRCRTLQCSFLPVEGVSVLSSVGASSLSRVFHCFCCHETCFYQLYLRGQRVLCLWKGVCVQV